MVTEYVVFNDFVGVSDSKESLQKLIDVVHGFCNRWKLRTKLSKSAVMVFSENMVKGIECGKSISFQMCLVSYVLFRI